MLRIRVAGNVYELAEPSAAELIQRLRGIGLVGRDETGEIVTLTTSAAAAAALYDAIHSRQVVDLDSEQLGSVRAAIEDWANNVNGGFDALPEDVVTLRHAIADSPR